MKNKLLFVSMPPHLRSGDKVSSRMYNTSIALLPALFCGVYFFGWRALLIVALSIVSSMLTEFVSCKIMGKTSTLSDGSAFLQGMILGMLLPPAVPWWIPVAGGFICISLGKQLFGGLGNYPFNPALVGFVVVSISWPDYMTNWLGAAGPFVGGSDLVQSPIELLKIWGILDFEEYGFKQLFMGNTPGAIGATSSLALLAGGLYLIWKKIIRWEIPAGFLGSMFFIATLCYMFDSDIHPLPWFHLVIGLAAIGAFFIATEPVTSPYTRPGLWCFGIGCGVMTMLIRLWGGHVDGVAYAILLMNCITPLFDRIRPRVYGRVKASA